MKMTIKGSIGLWVGLGALSFVLGAASDGQAASPGCAEGCESSYQYCRGQVSKEYDDCMWNVGQKTYCEQFWDSGMQDCSDRRAECQQGCDGSP